ncbi:MAG TPA: MaoC family dehydratase [Microvirga sp.]|jgi:acyl dehydratase|nr:MaoC family dehydratase [Microvirga sp.]
MNAHAPISSNMDALRARVGEEVGVSSWREVDQAMIDRFAAVTDDHQFIHVDPVRAARTSFGRPIAHGFLTLSLLSAFGQEALPSVEGRVMGINYGFDRVRFIAPVPVGSRVRGRFTLSQVDSRSAQEIILRYAVTVDLEGSPKPALSADWITLAVMS